MMRFVHCVLTACGLLCGASALAADDASPRPLVGAIRWDAWHGDKGEPGKAVQRALGPQKWHYRLPFFAEVESDEVVRIPGYTQEIVDQEIAFARHAGLDYWAFTLYDPDYSMSEGLKYYLSSVHKQDIKFCGIASPMACPVERIVRLMKDASYLTVLDHRSLFYLFCPDPRIGDDAGAKRWVAQVRTQAQQARLANPYLAIMGFGPSPSKQLADRLQCDAISAYTANDYKACGAPYRALAEYAEHYWDRCRETGAKVIPTAMAGHDRRPRVERPVPWERYQKPGQGIERYYEPARPAELAAHVAHAVQWVQQHPAAAEARAVIIYAWNENDEGGWLVPTLSEGRARIDALHAVLNSPGKSLTK